MFKRRLANYIRQKNHQKGNIDSVSPFPEYHSPSSVCVSMEPQIWANNTPTMLITQMGAKTLTGANILIFAYRG